MTFRVLVAIFIKPHTKVKLLAFANYRFIHIGEQYVFIIIYEGLRNHQQAMILSSVCCNNGGRCVSASPICAQQLPIKRIIKVYQLRFIKIDIVHNI